MRDNLNLTTERKQRRKLFCLEYITFHITEVGIRNNIHCKGILTRDKGA